MLAGLDRSSFLGLCRAVARSGELGSFFTMIFGGPPAFLALQKMTKWSAKFPNVNLDSEAVCSSGLRCVRRRVAYALGGEDLCAPGPRGLPLPDREADAFEGADARGGGGAVLSDEGDDVDDGP